MHPEFNIQENPHRLANPINKQVHSKSLFIRFACLEGNIFCILNSVCINLHITSQKTIFFLQILFYALLNDVNNFCDFTSSTLVARRGSVLKEIFTFGNYKLYFPQKLPKIVSDVQYVILLSFSLYVKGIYGLSDTFVLFVAKSQSCGLGGEHCLDLVMGGMDTNEGKWS